MLKNSHMSFSQLSERATKLWTFTLKRSVNGFKTSVLIYCMLMSLNSLLNLEPNMYFQAFLSQSAWNEEVSGPLRRFDLIAAQLTSGEHALCCQLKNKLRKKHNVEDELPSFPRGPGSLAQVLIHLKMKYFCWTFTLLDFLSSCFSRQLSCSISLYFAPSCSYFSDVGSITLNFAQTLYYGGIWPQNHHKWVTHYNAFWQTSDLLSHGFFLSNGLFCHPPIMHGSWQWYWKSSWYWWTQFSYLELGAF